MFESATRYFAQIVENCDPVSCTATDLQNTIGNLIEFMMTIAIAIAVIFILWGGILLLTSGGSSERQAKGKKAITAAVIGVVITLGAWMAIDIFITTFTSCGGSWNDFNLSC